MSDVRRGYKRTEVGVIPDEWEAASVSSLIDRARLGGNYPNTDAYSPYPLIKMGNMGRGNIDLTKIAYVPERIKVAKEHILSPGDVLLNTRNTLELVGKVCVWRSELREAYYNSNIIRFEFNKNKIGSTYFVNHAFNATNTVQRLRELATGTTSVGAVYTRDLLRFQIPLPPDSEQRAIAEALEDADMLVGALDALIGKKRDIKQGAVQELLTGQRRLPEFQGKWVIRKIGEIAVLQRGFDLPNSSIRFGPHPVIYSNGAVAQHCDKQVFGPGVVTGRSGTIGSVFFTEKDFWPHNTSFGSRIFEETIRSISISYCGISICPGSPRVPVFRP
jgi:type I restriction enzyme, S subunit